MSGHPGGDRSAGDARIEARPETGGIYRMWHPFKREEWRHTVEVGPSDSEWGEVSTPTWVPGWRYDICGPYGEDSVMAWDGEGEEIRHVVSVHKPGRFPTRVFYVRQWRDPNGSVFGKSALRITTLGAFRRWMSGERWRDNFRYERRVIRPLEAFLAALQCNADPNAPTQPKGAEGQP